MSRNFALRRRRVRVASLVTASFSRLTSVDQNISESTGCRQAAHAHEVRTHDYPDRSESLRYPPQPPKVNPGTYARIAARAACLKRHAMQA
eukprot:366512-Chlamydomonas_euryale.AAC.4